MSRSLLRQLEQIRNSYTYDDAVANVYTSSVAEPTISGTLEGDLNVLRTLVKELKGTTNWYDDLGNYFDPKNTDASDTETKDLTISNIKNNTLDSKAILVAIKDNNNNQGYTVSGTSTGVLLNITGQYATYTDRTGLPIFQSVTHSGTYYDEGRPDYTVGIDVIDYENQAEFRTNDGHIVYAKFHDGADFGGAGDGTDVYARFYANGSPIDLTTVSGGAPSKVSFVYPRRYVMSDLPEHFLRIDFVTGVEGDVEIMDDIFNLWSYTGSSDGVKTPQPWTNTTASYLLETDPDNLRDAIDIINTEVGSRLYTEDNYITDGEPISTSIDKLDQKLKDVEDSVIASAGVKYTEDVTSTITKNTPHNTPAAYTPDSTAGQEGQNMDVYVNGQLLAADTGVNGANADRDYGETSTTQITFRFNVRAGSNITYVIRQ